MQINKGTTNNKIIMQELHALSWLSALHNYHVTVTYLEGFRNTVADLVCTFLSALICYCFTESDHQYQSI